MFVIALQETKLLFHHRKHSKKNSFLCPFKITQSISNNKQF